MPRVASAAAKGADAEPAGVAALHLCLRHRGVFGIEFGVGLAIHNREPSVNIVDLSQFNTVRFVAEK
jgi:hypothetical protein